MSVVHISQFYPCSAIEYAGELYYVCELGKYLYTNYNEQLSLDGVILSKKLKNSVLWDMLRIAIKNGYLVNTNLSEDDTDISIQSPLIVNSKVFKNVYFTFDTVEFDKEDYEKRKSDLQYDLLTPKKMQVSLEKQTDTEWVWSLAGKKYEHFDNNSTAFNHLLSQQSWVSFVAMVAVERLKNNQPCKLIIKLDNHITLNFFAMCYLDVLLEKTSALSSWVVIDYSRLDKDTMLQVSYCSWYSIGKELGLVQSWHSVKEKVNYMKELDIKIGDVVLLYERGKSRKTSNIKPIINCHFAVIKDITKGVIVFDVINTIKTREQGRVDWADKTMTVKNLYNNKNPFDVLNHNEIRKPIDVLGIEHLLFDELFFIAPLSEAEDISFMSVTDGTRKDKLYLPQNDLVYWVFKDFNVQFDEQRFLNKYFKDRQPLYTRYMNGESLDEYKGV